MREMGEEEVKLGKGADGRLSIIIIIMILTLILKDLIIHYWEF